MPAIIHAELNAYIKPKILDPETLSQAMDAASIDVLALRSQPWVFDKLESDIRNYSNFAFPMRYGIIYGGPDARKFIFRSREYTSKEGFHLLTVGFNKDILGRMHNMQNGIELRNLIDIALENNAFPIIAHPFVDMGRTASAGHINYEQEDKLAAICEDNNYSGEIALEWNGYCKPEIRKTLKAGLNTVGIKTHYHDVNAEAEQLSSQLKEKGINIPIVAGTNLLANRKAMLSQLGTSRIEVYADKSNADVLLSSIKEHVFSGDYRNQKKYVSTGHWLEAYGFQALRGAGKTVLNKAAGREYKKYIV